MDLQDQNNPAEQVEKIRDILIGQDMQQVNDRIHKLEAALLHSNEEVSQRLAQQLEQTEHQFKTAQENLQAATENMRHQLHHESVTRGLQINDMASKIGEATEQMSEVSQRLLDEGSGTSNELVQQIENLSSEMNARIDAHSRQIMEHMHREIQQWKHRMNEQISALSAKKVDREELSQRLARIASAAMGDTATHPTNVTATNYTSSSIPRPNLGSLTGISPAMETPTGPTPPLSPESTTTPSSITPEPQGSSSLISPDIYSPDKDNPTV